ncbi:hypothetical protein QN382_07235 [Pseudomonas sp. 10B1]|uniref:hypothetical protein n=1 Tax=unclassified Pseudomonas TaxID=196821 RepID=UPI002B23461A|nr:MULTISPECIES: hypothetical protein [unclassified Pseudomonas]MEA9975743.1 hypothetical protein [Pseudomonas sp. RTS4]MEA9995757.1 hypothetical protein [Pseudomonas sp. AA4]MEB0085550.1 hypothetical protein [Pseudomonas sp. RTI1]MEB0124612.1 hypothetical protein [Pseudomonas sp. CCC1.2]MEB0152241.1 hypothetical protein [Pseudomonas sp. CCC4.3]
MAFQGFRSRNRTENNKTTSGSSSTGWIDIDKSSISAQKNTFALDPEWGSIKKAVKGTGRQKQKQAALE